MNFHLLITESSSFHIRNLHIDFYTWNIEISCFNVAKPVQVLETYLLESLYCIEDIQQPDVHIKKKKEREYFVYETCTHTITWNKEFQYLYKKIYVQLFICKVDDVSYLSLHDQKWNFTDDFSLFIEENQCTDLIKNSWKFQFLCRNTSIHILKYTIS